MKSKDYESERRKWELVLRQWKQICDVCGTPVEGQSHGACRMSGYEDTLQTDGEE
jgi:hypothetical protein